MMKIVGIVTIVVSFISFGFLKYIRLKKRPSELEFFISLVSTYLSDLKWRQSSIYEVISSFDNKSFEPYLKETKQLLTDYDCLHSFIEGNDYFKQFHLSSDDVSVLKYFFERIGKNSLDSEIELCQKILNKLEGLSEDAVLKYKRSGMLTLKLSLIFGLWLAVLLI